MLKRILYLLEESQERSTLGNGTSNECRIYTNKELMKLLGVESRYLKNLRDNGYLSYSRHGHFIASDGKICLYKSVEIDFGRDRFELVCINFIHTLICANMEGIQT